MIFSAGLSSEHIFLNLFSETISLYFETHLNAVLKKIKLYQVLLHVHRLIIFMMLREKIKLSDGNEC